MLGKRVPQLVNLMKFYEFRKAHREVWDRYFHRIYSDVSKKRVTLGDGVLLYPNLALYTETEDHYIAELFGATPKYGGLIPRKHKEWSTIKYLYQFADVEENPMFLMNARSNGLSHLLLSRDIDNEKVKQRFGIDSLELYPTQLRMTKEGGCLLSFGSDFKSCYLDNCLLINTYQQIYRIKSILHITIVSKTFTITDFLQDMKRELLFPVENTLLLNGIYYCPNGIVWGYILAGQFANLFLIPQLREPNMGAFLNANPEYTKKALNCVDFKHQQNLDWRNGARNLDRKYIQPDLLLKLKNGNWDICDLKKPLLDKINITKGQHSRRRFIDYIQEGIAQLANYESYFSFKKNSDFAKNKYGVVVNNPNLMLIVGNYENADIDEIKEASRMLEKHKYVIIDYDTLNANFLLRVKQA